MTKSPLPSQEQLDGLVREALTRSGKPLTAKAALSKLSGAVRPSESAVRTRLVALAKGGMLYRWRAGRADVYSNRPYADYLRDWIPEKLNAGPMSLGDLRVPKAASAILRSVVADLVATGRLYQHPRLEGKVRYGLRPPDAQDYIRRPLVRLVKDAARLGFAEADVADAVGRVCPRRSSEPAPANSMIEYAQAADRPEIRQAASFLLFLWDVRMSTSQWKEAFGRFRLLSEKHFRLFLRGEENLGVTVPYDPRLHELDTVAGESALPPASVQLLRPWVEYSKPPDQAVVVRGLVEGAALSHASLPK